MVYLCRYDSDLKTYVAVAYYYINATNITGLTNVTYEQFMQGYMPDFTPVDIPVNLEEVVHYEMEVSTASCKYWSPFHEDYITDGSVTWIIDIIDNSLAYSMILKDYGK